MGFEDILLFFVYFLVGIVIIFSCFKWLINKMKSKPAWLKGGVILGGIYIFIEIALIVSCIFLASQGPYFLVYLTPSFLLFPLGYFFSTSYINSLINSFFTGNSFNSLLPFFVFGIINTILFFLIGSIIGFIVGKIKSRNN